MCHFRGLHCGPHTHTGATPNVGIGSSSLAGASRMPPGGDGTGEPYLYASKPAVYLASACAGCNLTTYATLSVTPFGYDRGTCTLVSPCRTIQYAVNTAAPGSRIAIQRGVCRGVEGVGRHSWLASFPGITAWLSFGFFFASFQRTKE